MRQVAIAFILALAVGAAIGLLLAGTLDQVQRTRLIVGGSLFLALFVAGAIVGINREK